MPSIKNVRGSEESRLDRQGGGNPINPSTLLELCAIFFWGGKRNVSQQTYSPKTNMSPENQWLEDVFPIKIVPFKGTC